MWMTQKVKVMRKIWCAFPVAAAAGMKRTIISYAAENDVSERLWEKQKRLEDIYDRAMQELDGYTGSASGGIVESIFTVFENFYIKIRMLAVPVSGFSLFIGFLLLLLVRRDKLLFRRIFLTFIVIIPGFFALFTWGIGLLLN